MTKPFSLTVVIPSYNRGSVLLATIDLLLKQIDKPDEILIVDQTIYENSDPISLSLKELDDNNSIKWIRLSKPSIPAAMNKGLLTAKSDFVLFLDDDVTFNQQFIAAHRQAIGQSKGSAHVGQILQPGESGEGRPSNYDASVGLWRDLSFPFRSNTHALVHNCMAGNLLVDRQAAIQCGGFDEQFSGAAYRFETEFCRRMISHTKMPFHFIPEASLNHLQVPSGDTRHNVSSFLTSSSPVHSQGDYYFALRCGRAKFDKVKYIVERFFSGLCARFYLSKPWWIPVRVIAEVGGLAAARAKYKQGAKLINVTSD